MQRLLLSIVLCWGFASSFQVHRQPVVSRFHSTTYLRLTSDVPSQSDQKPMNHISIEYCTGCRWMLKSFWMAQELLTTFESVLDGVTVIPSSNKGVYAVHLNGENQLWDRKEQGGFPSPKELKQIVRDLVEPEKYLGHSDSEERQEAYGTEGNEIDEPAARKEGVELSVLLNEEEAPHPTVTITYCTGCRWLLRAAYFGQELLTTFGEDLKSVSLVPSKPPAEGGKFVSLIC